MDGREVVVTLREMVVDIQSCAGIFRQHNLQTV